MSCDDFMIADPPRLRIDTTLREAMHALFCNRVFALPVVDFDERFVGLIDVHQMLKRLLPTAVTMEHGLTDLPWVHDTGSSLAELRGRLDHVGDDPISGYLTTDTPTIAPGTSTLETVVNLYHRPGVVPVVDPTSGRLLGITTCWDLMAHIAEFACPT